ncbi:NADH-quinone oxidoreductase subunit C 1 [bacterium BMS3Bbin10]|nr:NADH-quinone oxidoreductase subunit C 1 [bacterium BMS3Bbin10]HDL16647.1 NADH-quinone oxidoreductase subunit C [Hyphomicrobiales bacterium]
MDGALRDIGEYLAEALGDTVVTGWGVAHGDLTLAVARESVPETLKFLKGDARCLFDCFIDIAGVDYPERKRRFDVVYHLLSPRQNLRIRVKTSTDETTPVPSVVDIFPGANWFEREAFDLFGILFSGHPDLRRILTDYGFQGHPLRKDFPLTGFVEMRYDEDLKRVVYEPVKLAQEFRSFDNMSPWEGAEYLLPGDEKADTSENGETSS